MCNVKNYKLFFKDIAATLKIRKITQNIMNPYILLTYIALVEYVQISKKYQSDCMTFIQNKHCHLEI